MEKIRNALKYWITIIVIIVVIASLPTLGRYYLKHFVDEALEKGSSSESLPDYRTSYIIPKPGEVVIHFKTTLSIEEIDTFLVENKLEAIPGSITLNLILASDAPNAQQQLQAYIEQLKAKNIIASCEETEQLLQYPNIFCLPSLKTPLETLDTFRNIDMALSVTPSSSPLATYVVKVPIGQENSLVAKLLQQPEVLSAIAPQ